jgi:hypothetical protein
LEVVVITYSTCFNTLQHRILRTQCYLCVPYGSYSEQH